MTTKERWVELLNGHLARHPGSVLQSYVFGVIESAAKEGDLDDIQAVLAAYHELTDQS